MEESFVENYAEIMLQREEGHIKIGNSIIQSKLGIFNYPKGFNRKTILCYLLREKMNNWHQDKIEFSFIEKYFPHGQIVKYKKIICQSTNYSIILCDERNIENWKRKLEKENLSYIHYDRKKHFSVQKTSDTVILINEKHISYLIEKYFSRLCIKRLIIFDPELMKSNYITQLFYGFVWIVSSEPIFLQSLAERHFIYNFIPRQIDLQTYNNLIICKDLKIQTHLKEKHNLPNFHLIKHSCRQEMYKILKGFLDEDIYQLFHHGKINQVLEKLNSISNCNNVIDYIYEKIENEMTEIDAKLSNYKNIKNKKEDDLEELKRKLVELQRKKQTFKDKIKEYTLDNECIICSEKMKNPIILYCCQQINCFSCMIKWLQTKNKCPYCRNVIHNDDIISLKNNFLSTSTTTDKTIETKKNPFEKLMTRTNKVIDIIQKYKNETLFFFSENQEMIEIMISFCIDEKVEYLELKETKKKNIYEDIKKNKIRLIILNDPRDLIGLQFPFVNHFISFDYLKKYLYKFICSRFYRIGRQNDFHFHSFVTFS